MLSNEHEDALASIDEGFAKAVAVLRDTMLGEQPSGVWWA